MTSLNRAYVMHGFTFLRCQTSTYLINLYCLIRMK
uniref:Uncharacterized protein n=1 Tax=Anguilla anguilla TaxID=7936 RepID=A0A0E9V2T7_ANGAN